MATNLPEQHTAATGHLSDVAGAASTPSGVANPSQLPPAPTGDSALSTRSQRLQTEQAKAQQQNDSAMAHGKRVAADRTARVAKERAGYAKRLAAAKAKYQKNQKNK